MLSYQIKVKYQLFPRYLNSWITQGFPFLEQVLQVSKYVLVVKKRKRKRNDIFLVIKFEIFNICWCTCICSQLHIFACLWITASSAYIWQTPEILLTYMLNSNVETCNWPCVRHYNTSHTVHRCLIASSWWHLMKSYCDSLSIILSLFLYIYIYILLLTTKRQNLIFLNHTMKLRLILKCSEGLTSRNPIFKMCFLWYQNKTLVPRAFFFFFTYCA